MKPALGVAFDLDDTLYLERDYVRSGFRAVAEYAVRGADVSAEDAFTFLWHDFLAGVRGSARAPQTGLATCPPPAPRSGARG